MNKEQLFALIEELKNSVVVYDNDNPAEVLELLKGIINIMWKENE